MRYVSVRIELTMFCIKTYWLDETIIVKTRVICIGLTALCVKTGALRIGLILVCQNGCYMYWHDILCVKTGAIRIGLTYSVCETGIIRISLILVCQNRYYTYWLNDTLYVKTGQDVLA